MRRKPSCWYAVVADHEERDTVCNQLLHAEPMPALALAQELEVCVQLCDQLTCVRTSWIFAVMDAKAGVSTQ
jgi:hypothetical protein